MSELPDPAIVEINTREAVQRNKRPATMLHEFLDSGRKEANFIANTLIDYRSAIRVLTSPMGRKYLHAWLDDTLNYLQKYAEEASK